MTYAGFAGCELPIIQAPMAGSQDVRLAQAVMRAGGLGSLPAAMLSPDALGTALAQLRDTAPGRFNVNFFCHTPPPSGDESDWRAALAPYYTELGLDVTAIPEQPLRQPFTDAIADVVEPFAPPVVSFHFGLPAAPLLARVKRWGSLVLSTATTVDEARWLQAHGADAVIAQGLEAGGHRGMFLTDDLGTQMRTLALVAQVVGAVNIPVIAAGGIADAAGVRAAMAQGASAVQVGTAYLRCPEATTSAVHRAALDSVAAGNPAAQHTAITNLFSGRPARGIVNRLMRELGPMSPLPPAFPLASTAIAPLRKAAEAAGQGDFSPLWAGENVLEGPVVSAGDLTRRLAAI
ncbi:nitronate monooxygenase [Alcanivorax sp. JB21]|uniref:NAD(P)H-dependent flavin oxidoreductase n=1 Tax=Alcanivorax limicola TaxID=2874102 RepID=UPI001CBC363A|nr:nitronate monooxygenase [Alcanivorax limicola]MBZ2188899.1 nitronate monooxygenase [Alcanivorax limicola]